MSVSRRGHESLPGFLARCSSLFLGGAFIPLPRLSGHLGIWYANTDGWQREFWKRLPKRTDRHDERHRRRPVRFGEKNTENQRIDPDQAGHALAPYAASWRRCTNLAYHMPMDGNLTKRKPTWAPKRSVAHQRAARLAPTWSA